ncbi:MAG: hypothetical protein OEZ58_05390 [Gammaproteobacteria bacterium]|nr:hypothetical protein [Gammaproteobacteria bacterium]MDH5728399.1 hypothetical protein [Gammaproteobacteria bacterium]
MKKRLYLMTLSALILAAPLIAQAESAAEYCRSEAMDSGIESENEIRAYVAECVEQMEQETGANTANNTESSESMESASMENAPREQ